MELFESYYPNVTFVYTTNNAQAYGDYGLQRAQNNQQIRDYCIANNKVLFDFGDLDSWYNGEQNTTTYNGTTYQVQHNAFDGQECGHVNLLGAEYKARAIWWMLARLQGWDPTIVQGLDILVDHNSTDYQSIPMPVIDDVQANIRFHYAHYSHGSQLLCGLQQIEDNNSEYSVAIGGGYNGENTIPPYLPTETGALCIYNGNCGYTIENTMYWKPIPSNHCTENTLNSNPTLNVSGWQWCEELNGFSAEETQQYLDAMNAYEQQYPNVTFVYMTSNAMAGGAAGYNRHMRCDQIREYCATNHKVLFDFEDLDSWYNGEHYTYQYNGEDVPYMHPAYGGNDCGHANDLNSLNKGTAVWYMMALIRGWDPSVFVNQAPHIEPQYLTHNQQNIGIEYVGTVVASDPDPGQTIVLSIISGNESGQFIMQQNGDLYYTSLSIAQAEESVEKGSPIVSKYPAGMKKYLLGVKVMDSYTPSLSDSANVSIAINKKVAPSITWWIENGTLFFKFPFENEDFGKCILQSMYGYIAFDGWCYPGVNQIDISVFNPGTYILILTGGETGKIVSCKIVIQ